MKLSESAKRRLRLANLQNLFELDTEETLIEIILQQSIVSESNHLATISFDISDIIEEE